jgi:hypothetical protein
VPVEALPCQPRAADDSNNTSQRPPHPLGSSPPHLSVVFALDICPA